jgi:hypothetical protein
LYAAVWRKRVKGNALHDLEHLSAEEKKRNFSAKRLRKQTPVSCL